MTVQQSLRERDRRRRERMEAVAAAFDRQAATRRKLAENPETSTITWVHCEVAMAYELAAFAVRGALRDEE